MVDAADLKSSEQYVRAGSSPAFGTTNNFNTMSKEAYCSFEVAKLLKEKGFDWNCIGYYVNHEPNDVKHSLLGETNSTWESRCCSAPTHQMAFDWFREKEIFIIINYSRYYKTYRYNIYSMNIDVELDKEDWGFKSYEDASNAALLYSLNNLI